MSFAKIRPRRGTANEWSSVNPILVEGEIGIEVPDSGVGTGKVKIKFGDGVKRWNDLPYGVTGEGSGGFNPEDLPDNLLTEDDIINNATTDDPTKAVSASVAKSLQDQINDVSTDVLTKDDIVNNAVTDSADKVVSASVAKSLQDNVDTIQDTVDTIQDNVDAVQDQVDSLTTGVSNINKRNFILIGDSFGGGVISGTQTGKGWIDHFKEYTKDKYTVYNNQIPLGGVYGFASSRPFLDVLKDCETQIEDKNTITDIVVLGGTNDISVDKTLIEPAIKAFAEYCHANFPNALVKIGLVGTNISSLYGLVPYYRNCNKYGCVFIQDTLCLMCDTSYISDGTHLTQDGYDFYDPYICNAILSGNCNYKFGFHLTISNSILQNSPTVYVEITEKGYIVTFSNQTDNDFLKMSYFSFTPTTKDSFMQLIGKINLPKLFAYRTRLQNGITYEVDVVGGRYISSPSRAFSIWFDYNGDLYANLGTPFYNDLDKTQTAIVLNEPYTYLI